MDHTFTLVFNFHIYNVITKDSKNFRNMMFILCRLYQIITIMLLAIINPFYIVSLDDFSYLS